MCVIERAAEIQRHRIDQSHLPREMLELPRYGEGRRGVYPRGIGRIAQRLQLRREIQRRRAQLETAVGQLVPAHLVLAITTGDALQTLVQYHATGMHAGKAL